MCCRCVTHGVSFNLMFATVLRRSCCYSRATEPETQLPSGVPGHTLSDDGAGTRTHAFCAGPESFPPDRSPSVVPKRVSSHPRFSKTRHRPPLLRNLCPLPMHPGICSASGLPRLRGPVGQRPPPPSGFWADGLGFVQHVDCSTCTSFK